jgi:hypothetical protein
MAANKVTAARGGLYLDQRTFINLGLLEGPERLFFCDLTTLGTINTIANYIHVTGASRWRPGPH